MNNKTLTKSSLSIAEKLLPNIIIGKMEYKEDKTKCVNENSNLQNSLKIKNSK
jgi:hypothetical protein